MLGLLQCFQAGEVLKVFHQIFVLFKVGCIAFFAGENMFIDTHHAGMASLLPHKSPVNIVFIHTWQSSKN